jgi:hypothetical protein
MPSYSARTVTKSHPITPKRSEIDGLETMIGKNHAPHATGYGLILRRTTLLQTIYSQKKLLRTTAIVTQ